MKKKIKRWYKETKNKVKKVKNKIKRRVTSSPIYVRFILIRNKIAEYILDGLLAALTYLSPVLTFLCIKKEDFDGPNGFRNNIRSQVIQC